jgi:hypothetical protein
VLCCSLARRYHVVILVTTAPSLLQVKSCVSLPAMSLPHARPSDMLARAPAFLFPSARNAHQRTVGALLSVYRTVPPCFAAVLQLRETQFRMPAGMLVLLSLNGHWTMSAWLRVPACQSIGDRLINMYSIIFHAVLSRALKQMPSQPAFRVLTHLDVNVRVIRPQACY